MQKESGRGEPSVNGRAADILLVEDDAVHASLMLRALKMCGFADRTEHVSDGAEALEYLASVNLLTSRPASIPKLILLDLGLPKIGGMHVLRQLKSDPRTKSIPVVVLTSSKIAIELMESYKLGVNSYVIKPYEASKFTELIADISRYWLVINEPPPV
jgi:two-component system, response regulator